MNRTTSKQLLCGMIITLILGGSDDGWSQEPQKTLTLGIPVRLSDSGIKDLLTNPKALPMVRLQKMLRQLGYGLTLAYYPGERSLTEANSGEADGELARDIITPELYPNLICATYYKTSRPSLFGLKTTAQQQTSPAFVESIATPRGSPFLALILPSHLARTEIIKTNRHIQSIRLVVSGRTQAALMDHSIIHHLRKTYPREARQLVPLQPQLEPLPVYTFLHKKHKYLIEALSQQREFASAGQQQLPCLNNQQQHLTTNSAESRL